MSKPKSKFPEWMPTEKLCFDETEFMKENFSVDEFLHKNRNAPSLEQLRDNLGLYLKGLRSAMIDLINDDYADFVNLSANLVGLDGSISTIKQPLESFHLEIASIKDLIAANELEIKEQLSQKRQLQQMQRNLHCLRKVYKTQKTLEDLLAEQLSGTATPSVVHLERASLELIQLKFNEKFAAVYLNDSQKSTIEKLQQEIMDKLRLLFNDALKQASSTNSECLERCLRVYITLDACHLAEKAFAEDVVAPYMSDIISEHSLQNSPQALGGIYIKIMNFISLHMTDLLRLTAYSDKLKGFNFLLNSFWSEVEWRLEAHMASIFAPGNADIFYEKFRCTQDFLVKIQQLLTSEVDRKAFRQHKQTKSFMNRWNLPVYFQICVQNIAGPYEAELEPPLRHAKVNLNDSLSADAFYLPTPFGSALQAAQRCWSEGVYLEELFPKFFKLTIQIVVRLSRWVNDVICLTTANAQIAQSLDFFTALYADLLKLTKHHIPLLHQTILNLLPKGKYQSTIEKSISSAFAELDSLCSQHLLTIQSSLVQMLIKECGGLDTLQQVHDLPRLYRKTNRDIPTRPSAYVEQLWRPLRMFHEQRVKYLGRTVVESILKQVLTQITSGYYSAVADVLTSVQKTEESLRRLRNLKGAPAAAGGSETVVTDDDKIRLQLRVDVNAWAESITKINIIVEDIDRLQDLRQLVEHSIKSKS